MLAGGIPVAFAISSATGSSCSRVISSTSQATMASSVGGFTSTVATARNLPSCPVAFPGRMPPAITMVSSASTSTPAAPPPPPPFGFIKPSPRCGQHRGRGGQNQPYHPREQFGNVHSPLVSLRKRREIKPFLIEHSSPASVRLFEKFWLTQNQQPDIHLFMKKLMLSVILVAFAVAVQAGDSKNAQ